MDEFTEEELEAKREEYDEELEALGTMETSEIRDLAHGYINSAARATLIEVVTELREDFWW